MNAARQLQTGQAAQLLNCHCCGQLAPAAQSAAHKHCRRCGAALHMRHPDSLNRTWALLIAAMIFYIPANLMPMMVTTALGSAEGDTIMQGIIYFLQSGDWPIAAVIFTASILVPLLKMIALLYLLISVQRQSTKRPTERTKIYRAVEFVGRWSMLDVFVVTIMVALVQLGNLATIVADTGAIFFCAVVIITMLAAESFDPRLIWDNCKTDE